MADVVLGVGTSHTPQISVPWAEWPTLGRTQEPSPHIPEDLDAQLQPEAFQRRHAAAQAAVKQLGQVLRRADLDAIVIFGDDQHEQFDDSNMPAVAIYHGETVEVRPRRPRPGFPTLRFEETAADYPNSAELACHLIACLTEQEFEI